MQGYNMEKEITLNESFKALLENIFSDADQAKKLIQAFEEFANDRATTQRLNFENLKQEAIEQIRNELVSKDLFHSEIKRLEDLFHSEIKRLEAEIKRVESSLQSEIKRVESSIQTEIKRVESSLQSEIKLSVSSLKQQGIYWLIGACVVSIATIISSVWAIMNFTIEHLK
ncbi:BdrR [Campylobacter jejuni subsp. doylei]|uniref:BdrR n=1 Tax=Campylobacter jejuni subsp. doylei TaxID=32021 RepID=A0A448J6U3_CAMJU|nr:BdrR [Campylobacter jejuni subsp. doylei]